jgi:hypothetical protein
MPEYIAPGVYVVEVPFEATSIEGVDTSTSAFTGPAWTDANAHEPGITLAGLFGFLTESLLYRERAATGVVGGLAVDAGAGGRPAVTVSPGVAVDGTGDTVEPDPPWAQRLGAADAHWRRKD